YVYYPVNLDLNKQSVALPISQIIKDMSSEGAIDPIIVKNNNAIILSDISDVISSIITIISQIDKLGFREVIEVIPLFHINSKEAASILNKIKKASGDSSEFNI